MEDVVRRGGPAVPWLHAPRHSSVVSFGPSPETLVSLLTRPAREEYRRPRRPTMGSTLDGEV